MSSAEAILLWLHPCRLQIHSPFVSRCRGWVCAYNACLPPIMWVGDRAQKIGGRSRGWGEPGFQFTRATGRLAYSGYIILFTPHHLATGQIRSLCCLRNDRPMRSLCSRTILAEPLALSMHGGTGTWN
ncbi:uncharacterized protein BDV14DRAFT_115734 [Aspergillus stella-maris]|uniref:uncharacterized protein n=1 Tax=Aspergillus stella-maris TaxID=1810926 RepID=UPI003CCD90E1